MIHHQSITSNRPFLPVLCVVCRWVENKRRFLDDSYQRAVAAGRKGSITSEAAGDEKADRT